MYYIVHSQEIGFGYLQVDMFKNKPEGEFLTVCNVQSKIISIESYESYKAAVNKLLKFRKDYCEFNVSIGDYIPRSERMHSI